MRGHPVLRAATVLALGIVGLVGGHAVGYAVAVPDVLHRTTLLVSTGHAYLPSASWLALVAGVAAIVTGIASGRLPRAPSSSLSLVRVAIRLASLQCLGFVALEVAERAVTSSPIHLLSVRLLAIGLLAQVVCAAVGALVIVGLRRIGAALVSRRSLSSVAPGFEVVLVGECPSRSRGHTRERVRDPPAPLFA
jgi:hypothetical protein